MKRETFEERSARAKQEMERREAQSLAELKAFVPSIPVPEGWFGEFVDDSYWTNGGHVNRENYQIVSPEGDIKIVFRMGGPGSTNFRIGEKWYTFDRRGVDDSFYWLPWGTRERKTPLDIAAIIREQIERVKDRRLFHERALDVPGIGFKIDPETKAKYIEALKAPNGHITFTPSGFGTGYTVARFDHVTKNGSGFAGYQRWKRASAALDDFFSVGPLWIERIDCD